MIRRPITDDREPTTDLEPRNLVAAVDYEVILDDDAGNKNSNTATLPRNPSRLHHENGDESDDCESEGVEEKGERWMRDGDEGAA